MNTFETERLQLAVYLHAVGKLKFIGCQRVGNNTVRFVFEDHDGLGDKLELEYENGATVPAVSLFASQKYLRRKMSEALEDRRTREAYGNRNS